MQDSLKSSMQMSNISVRLNGDRRMVQKFMTGEPVVISSPVEHGSAITISVQPHRASGNASATETASTSVVPDMFNLVIKGNPIGFLSGQNVYGTCDMPTLNIALFRRLQEMGVLKFTDAQWRTIHEGNYQINEVAFAQYFVVNSNTYMDKIMLMSYVKRLYAAAMTPTWPISVHMYPGAGMIVRRRDQTLCIYDKQSELLEKQQPIDNSLCGDLTEVADKLRFESTYKYNWLQSHRRLWVRDWDINNWSNEARRLVLRSCATFKLEYIMRCPNICDRKYGMQFTARERSRFLEWTANEVMDSRTIKHFRTNYGLDMELSAEAHRNMLFTRLQPFVNVSELFSGESTKLERALRALRKGVECLGTSEALANQLLPLSQSIRGSGPRPRVERVAERAGLMLPRKHGKFSAVRNHLAV